MLHVPREMRVRTAGSCTSLGSIRFGQGERAPATNRVSVLVVDSNQMHAQLLSSALRRRAEFSVDVCGTELNDILQKIRTSHIQIVIINVENGEGSARNLGVVQDVHLACPEVPQIVMANSHNRELVVTAIRSGARGIFCFAESHLRELRKCIHSVHQGQLWINNNQLQFLVDALIEGPSLCRINTKGASLLTTREKQVVALVASAYSNREIADQLQIRENTVKKSLLRIFDKLGVSTRVELVLYALASTQVLANSHGEKNSPGQGNFPPVDKAVVGLT
jgi:DNA-binding NarL/FixJ family response regulator